jgi:hypothetical protein
MALRCLMLSAAFVAVLAPGLANGDEPRRQRQPAGHDNALRGKAPKQEDADASAQLFDSSRLESTGSLLLEDIMKLIRQSPRLADEVNSALDEIKTTPQDIACIGRRMDGRWRYLAGARVQPYICRFGARWLEISADLRVYGRRGESYRTVSEIATTNARTIKESNPRWTWTSTRPREWLLE